MVDKREITPDLLARLTVVLFKNISIRAVLEQRIRFDALSADDIMRLMLRDDEYKFAQSPDSCRALAYSVIDYVTKKTEWQGNGSSAGANRLNMLDLLLLTVQDLLTLNNDQPQCRYEELMAWRKVVRYLGEELPLSAKYAQWDHEHGRQIRDRCDDFLWPYLTGHNNKQLNMLVQRGVSEHHCHMWASTPHFHVSWINLMNRVTDSGYRENLRKFNPEKWSSEDDLFRRQTEEKKRRDAAREHYGELSQIRAAWIRLYLCERIMGLTNADHRYYDLQNVRSYDSWRQLLRSSVRLQSELNAYSYRADWSADYAPGIAKLKKTAFASDYHVLIGERWLYYRVLRDYLKKPIQRSLKYDDYNLFFVYILIRLWMRKKMVQNNDCIGFDNFQKIERRKGYFLNDPYSERSLIRLTINDALKKEYLKEMEVRISPIPRQVKQLDGYVDHDGKSDPVRQHLIALGKIPAKKKLQDRYYYVFHFLKRPDPSVAMEDIYVKVKKTRLICRHEQLRRAFLNQAEEVIRFRETEPERAQRVRGIDAASRELGCRPEVLGTVYRLLGDHKFEYGGYEYAKRSVPALGKTYHVGEDFLDVVDGLRAIDEVIHFLDFDCGDRLGHALALGVDVEDWYEQKGREVSLTIQDYLDNLAWLYHALTHYSVPNVGPLKERLNRDFEYWFRIVYRNSFDQEKIDSFYDSASAYYKKTGEDHGRYNHHSNHFDIMDYYRAWTLRGDDPTCYIDGFFKKPIGSSLQIPAERAKICSSFPPNFEDRYISEYSFLNYMYQYDDDVRDRGKRRIKIDISREYIGAIKAVQREMRLRIARKGIAIETNPTSNVLIGTFREYRKHPMLAFFNQGLPVTTEEERDCPQIQISINTDDGGVFYTDLSTEYALIARALEQIEDEQGQPRFRKNDIYTWLDHIRVMGNEQTFRVDNH